MQRKYLRTELIKYKPQLIIFEKKIKNPTAQLKKDIEKNKLSLLDFPNHLNWDNTDILNKHNVDIFRNQLIRHGYTLAHIKLFTEHYSHYPLFASNLILNAFIKANPTEEVRFHEEYYDVTFFKKNDEELLFVMRCDCIQIGDTTHWINAHISFQLDRHGYTFLELVIDQKYASVIDQSLAPSFTELIELLENISNKDLVNTKIKLEKYHLEKNNSHQHGTSLPLFDEIEDMILLLPKNIKKLIQHIVYYANRFEWSSNPDVAFSDDDWFCLYILQHLFNMNHLANSSPSLAADCLQSEFSKIINLAKHAQDDHQNVQERVRDFLTELEQHNTVPLELPTFFKAEKTKNKISRKISMQPELKFRT